MTEVDGKMFCSRSEYIEKMNEYHEVGDKVVTGNLDGEESLILYNRYGCMLSSWTPCDGTEDKGEYREY